MQISLAWLKELISLEAGAEEIASRLSVSGLEVEDVRAWETIPGGLKGFVIGEVLEKHQHPNADRLSCTLVDVGQGEALPIVCGASNVAVGQKVVVALVGTTVSIPGKEAFEIKEAKIRGEVSRGMICAEDEMGMGSSHDGILVLEASAKTGMQAAEHFDISSDTILEIGLTANRGDAASHLGVARDLAALFGKSVNFPALKTQPKGSANTEIKIEDASDCRRYVALEIKGVKIGPSPKWMQDRLRSIGLNPINNVVDCGNYVMHELGQPLHAFDLDKLRGGLQVRRAIKGEKLVTLDKVSREFKGVELLIADSSGPVAIAGVLGGLDSGVGENTKDLLLESACFSAGAVRKSAKAHGLSTDASYRFERGTDVELCERAVLRLADLILETAGGSVQGLSDNWPDQSSSPAISLDYNKMTRLAGAEIPRQKATEILTALGFGLERVSDTEDLVQVPSFKSDCKDDVDILEEILRIQGYDTLPMSGKMSISLGSGEGVLAAERERRLRQYLIGRGFYEIMNNSLVAEEEFEWDKEPVKLSNPLSTELGVMRPSLKAGMLRSMAYNMNRRMEDLRFFEFGKIYSKAGDGFKELNVLAIGISGQMGEESWEGKAGAADFYYLKSTFAHAMASAGLKEPKGLDERIQPVEEKWLKHYGIEQPVWYGEIVLDGAATLLPIGMKIKDVPKFPFMRRDLSLVLDKDVPYSKLESLLKGLKSELFRESRVFDLYAGKSLEAGKKAVAIAFYFGHEERTLTDKEVDAVMEKLAGVFEKEAGAVIRK